MGERWKPYGFQLSLLVALMLVFRTQMGNSLNEEGLALLKFRERVDKDPGRAFANWNPDDANPCLWMGIGCVEEEVHMLDLRGFSLEGTLAPELEKLSHLRSLVLCDNNFSGFIPKEIGRLRMLEVLDLRNNNLTGMVPADMVSMLSLKELLLHGNRLYGQIPSELEKFTVCSDLQLDQNLTSSVANETNNRHRRFKFGKEKSDEIGDNSCSNIISISEQVVVSNVKTRVNIVRRRLIEMSAKRNDRNLPAVPAIGANLSEVLAIVSLKSGAYPAVKKAKLPPHSDLSPSSALINPSESQKAVSSQRDSSIFGIIYTYVVPAVVFALVLSVLVVFFLKRKKEEKTRPSISGLHGSLKKAIVEGITKLNRAEVESACEEFSNIICTPPCCIVYKGTLTSGVEISTVSTTVAFAESWSKHAQKAFKEKLDSLSRVNHKNFVNLLGYCEEEVPFTRMMVFEFAPNGSLYEHLHVEGAEHIDWNARVRIIMGIAYCLQYMHHDLIPHVVHLQLQSDSILLTDDYAAKVGEISFWVDFSTRANMSQDKELDTSKLPEVPSLQDNVYSFGVLILEIITGKLPHDEEQGYLVKWASEYLVDEQKNNSLVDPNLKSSKKNELDIICEVILDCIHDDPNQRPMMKDVVSKLRQVIQVTPDQATPKLSPLWWAELELLSNEGS